jgi:hypothetical protein
MIISACTAMRRRNRRLNMELDLQSLFRLHVRTVYTAELIG